MAANKNFQPNWVSSPGETIVDILQEKGISIPSFATAMKLHTIAVQKLLSGQSPINEQVAVKLVNICGGSYEFWMTRQAQFEVDTEELIRRQELDWLNQIPVKDMLKFGWVQDSNGLVEACLKFFGVESVLEWKEKYENVLVTSNFRKSPAFASKIGAVAAWIRRGEIKTGLVDCLVFDAVKFEETLHEIKPLSRKKSPKEFLPKLIEKCAKCGVAVAVIPTPVGCPASGLTRFLSPKKAMMLLSFRYLSDDQFWFTFFHEAGHILLHNQNLMFIEGMHDELTQAQEHEANIFAGEMLIPFRLQDEMRKLKGNKRDIINFSIKAAVSPGIVVGQMQHYGYFDNKYLNGYKRRYDWDQINEY